MDNISLFLAVVPILSRHADLIRSLTAQLPEVEAAINEGQVLINKHQKLIQSLERQTPEIQALINEVMTAIQQAQRPSQQETTP